MFSTLPKTISFFLSHLFCRLQMLSIWTSLKFCRFGKEFINPFPNKPWFLRVCSRSLLKTLWEKEKLLVTSNFSFSHCVFYPFGELSAILNKFEIVVCNLSIWESLKFVVWERVNLLFEICSPNCEKLKCHTILICNYQFKRKIL